MSSSLRKSARLVEAADLKELIAQKKAEAQANGTTNGVKRKYVFKISEPADDDDVSSTPKRKKIDRATAPPFTPTPGGIGGIGCINPYASSDEGTPPPPVRLAAPENTNATLISPQSRKTVAPKPLAEISPSKVSKIKTTTENILEKALAHLIKVEPKLKPVIEKYPCTVFSPEGLAERVDPFNSLVSGIISQQVSGAAARTIKGRFVAIFNVAGMDAGSHTFPLPIQVARKGAEYIRPAGLSAAKADYIVELAEHFVSGLIDTKLLFEGSYQEVYDALIQVRGIGPWSVQMFACFALKRFDIFAVDDLGVQRGMAILEGKDVSKLKNSTKKYKYMSKQEMVDISAKFAPYRSVYMWYIWKCADVNIATLDEVTQE